MHTISLVHVDREDWASQLKAAITKAALRHAGKIDAIRFAEDEAAADLVICLGSALLAKDANARSQIRAALARQVRVLPVVSALPKFKSEVPEELYPINGTAWVNLPSLAEEVLQHLGLTERDRRVFLSYLRRETTPMAYQLYDELHRRRFSTFLDTCEIEHGERVQDRIEQALQSTSFVLLLYSPSVETSEWIEKEINFALTHGLGLLALALPDAEKKAPFKMTPSDRRLQLQKSDRKVDGRLTAAALKRVCLAIEQEHADQFRSRRERLIHDVNAALGGSAVRVGTQSLRFKGLKSDVFIRLSARPAEARDLFLLDRDCPIIGGETPPPNRVLVAVKGGYRENREMTAWMCEGLRHPVRWREPQVVCDDPGVLEDGSWT
jgi:hypothetical protein